MIIDKIYSQVEKNKLYDEARNRFGDETQIIVAIEELSEMQKELTKILRGEGDRSHLAEEIADVEIVAEQIKRMFCITESVSDFKNAKLLRLSDRVYIQKTVKCNDIYSA